jgi:GTP-binding protein EngB required for normal cell division
MDKYLTGRKTLKRVYVVIDARHAPNPQLLDSKPLILNSNP